MRRQWKKISHLLPKLLCVLMAFHLFNLSMDSKDAQPDFIPEDLAHNDLESISEFVTEVVFGVDNSFAEHDEDDQESATFHNLLKQLMCSVTADEISLSFDTACIRYYVMNARLVPSVISRIKVPPPQDFHSSTATC